MDTTSWQCVLCLFPARVTDTGSSDRIYVACSNTGCGDYEISKQAAREIAARPEQRSMLKDQVVHANVQGEVLEITTSVDGVIKATSAKHR